MKSIFFKCLLLIILCLASLDTSFAENDNPKPYKNDFILPMPGNHEMVFRPVSVGNGDDPFVVKEFKMGGSNINQYKEYPTSVIIGGSFIKKNSNGYSEWIYYIGKYEVTKNQFNSVMADKSNPKNESNSQQSGFPVTDISWFDANEFIHKYNMWLMKNAKEALPKYGFIRLPTEVEWEFAARGGKAVKPTHFDKTHPYPEPLNAYEWYYGKESSKKGKIKRIGKLKPNDLFIHDILGNVSEMTHSLYQIEYYQGRVGGFVARGGNTFTEKKYIRSSLRKEIGFYKRNKVSKQSKLGFRLAIASPVLFDKPFIKKCDKSWKNYANKHRRPPTTKSLSPVTEQTNIQISDAIKSIGHIKSELSNTYQVSDTIMKQIGRIEASMNNVVSILKKAEHDTAYAWVKVASQIAYLLHSREIKELPIKKALLVKAEKIGRSKIINSIKKQIKDKKRNIEEGLNSYRDVFEQLASLDKEVVLSSFEKHNKFLKSKGVVEQDRINEIVIKHYLQYHKSRRADIDKWRKDLD